MLESGNKEVSLHRQTVLLNISRSFMYYTNPKKEQQSKIDEQIMGEIDKIYTEYPFYGTRRIEVKSNKLLKGSRYLLLKNPENLKEDSLLKLEELKRNNSVLAEAYQMKENIKDFFEKDTKQSAELFLKLWCYWVLSSGIEPMKKVVKTIKTHWNGIMNYIEKTINNGIVEGINSIIQTIKRRARGFRNLYNFKTMIYLKIGDFPILSSKDIT